jgi:molecular chaperone GrpE
VRFSTGTDTKGDTQEVDTASTDAATADATEAEAATPENVDVPALVTELETRRADIKELEQKNLDLNNQLLRSLAEQENVRSIARRDVENTRKFGIQKFALELLEVSDNLKRAAECVPIEFRTRPEGDDDPSELVKSMVSLYEGVSMTERVMMTALGKFGVAEIASVGEKVDLKFHDVKFAMASDEIESGHVAVVVRAGYMMEERVLRAAEVGVVS